MQTFLPYPDFEHSAAVLDDRRLGKQRVEVLQILRALHFEGYGWRNHPAVAMWRTFVPALVAYGDAVTHEWLDRGYGDTVLAQMVAFVAPGRPRSQDELRAAGLLPPWLGWQPLHRSHQAALMRKDPAHYRRYFSDVDPDVPYVWPPLPPEPPPDLSAPSAWVVRPSSDDAAEAFLDHRIIGLPLPPTPRALKRRREVQAFRTEIVVGNRVLVPSRASLLLGTVTGDVEPADALPGVAASGLAVVRPVTWNAELVPSALRWPAALQNPSLVFPVRGEDDIVARVTFAAQRVPRRPR